MTDDELPRDSSAIPAETNVSPAFGPPLLDAGLLVRLLLFQSAHAALGFVIMGEALQLQIFAGLLIRPGGQH